MKTIVWHGNQLHLPSGRLGRQQAYTLDYIRTHGQAGIWRAMCLRGRAKQYAGRYQAAFDNLAAHNSHLLHRGYYGERGGIGYKWLGV